MICPEWFITFSTQWDAACFGHQGKDGASPDEVSAPCDAPRLCQPWSSVVPDPFRWRHYIMYVVAGIIWRQQLGLGSNMLFW